jgi:hypothetical protein
MEMMIPSVSDLVVALNVWVQAVHGESGVSFSVAAGQVSFGGIQTRMTSLEPFAV